jgi:hypothetical protein
MGKSFKHITVCTVGKFGDNTDKIPLWMNANGGTYSRVLDDSVTHLVVTEDAYKVNSGIGTFVIIYPTTRGFNI